MESILDTLETNPEAIFPEDAYASFDDFTAVTKEGIKACAVILNIVYGYTHYDAEALIKAFKTLDQVLGVELGSFELKESIQATSLVNGSKLYTEKSGDPEGVLAALEPDNCCKYRSLYFEDYRVATLDITHAADMLNGIVEMLSTDEFEACEFCNMLDQLASFFKITHTEMPEDLALRA